MYRYLLYLRGWPVRHNLVILVLLPGPCSTVPRPLWLSRSSGSIRCSWLEFPCLACLAALHRHDHMPHQSLAPTTHARCPMLCSSPCTPTFHACRCLSHRYHAWPGHMVSPGYCLVARCSTQKVAIDCPCQEAGVLYRALHWLDGFIASTQHPVRTWSVSCSLISCSVCLHI